MLVPRDGGKESYFIPKISLKSDSISAKIGGIEFLLVSDIFSSLCFNAIQSWSDILVLFKDCFRKLPW